MPRKGQSCLQKIGKSFYRYTWEYVDSDYLDSLPDEERAYMIQFLLEYYRCESNRYGERRLLTKEMVLDAFKRNTAAYKDVLSYRDKQTVRLGTQEDWEAIAEVPFPDEGTERTKKPRRSRPGPLDAFFNGTTSPDPQ